MMDNKPQATILRSVVFFRPVLHVSVHCRQSDGTYRSEYEKKIIGPPSKFRSAAREYNRKQIRERLDGSFFISPDSRFDLVRYQEEATKLTYLRWDIEEASFQDEGNKNGK